MRNGSHSGSSDTISSPSRAATLLTMTWCASLGPESGLLNATTSPSNILLYAFGLGINRSKKLSTAPDSVNPDELSVGDIAIPVSTPTEVICLWKRSIPLANASEKLVCAEFCICVRTSSTLAATFAAK